MYYCGRCIWDGCPDKAFCEKQHEMFTPQDAIIRDIEDEPKHKPKPSKPRGRKRHVPSVHKRV